MTRACRSQTVVDRVLCPVVCGVRPADPAGASRLFSSQWEWSSRHFVLQSGGHRPDDGGTRRGGVWGEGARGCGETLPGGPWGSFAGVCGLILRTRIICSLNCEK